MAFQGLATRTATATARPQSPAKRAFDLVFASVALVALAPLLAVLLLCIVIDSRGNPLFAQERVGLHGRRFRMWKLRTMCRDAEQRRAELEKLNQASYPLFKIHRDPRVTRVGRLLRASSLDELPQLWNIVRGDMSLVGPRPCLPGEVVAYSDEQARRLTVAPGLTGLWQVSGRSSCSFDDYVSFDIEYIDGWSFWLDMRLIARTFLVVVMGRGAY